MSNLSTYTSVFRANAGHRAKRNRQPVSCTTCQRRKTRCDRQQPCNACCQRGDPERCKFGALDTAEGATAAVSNGGVGTNVGSKKEVQARLTKLEEIVKNLASGTDRSSTSAQDSGSAGSSNTEDGGEESETRRRLRVDRADGGSFHGATSWASLVDNIRDIQHMLEDGGDTVPGSSSELMQSDAPRPAPECFLTIRSQIDLQEILDALPPRQDTDKLVLIFFNAKFVAIPFIHAHQFRRQYDAFWEDPSSASYLWVSILFSILAIGLNVAQHSSTPPAADENSITDPQQYLILASKCFIAGEYFRAKPLSVEALLMHVHSRNVIRMDSDPSIWTFYGLALRIAQRQGYHREMDKVSARATPFAAEMRRRAWFMLRAMDILHSSQQGMPPMVDVALCDTKNPTNLTDEDFDEDTVVLPPARSATDPSPMLIYVNKASLCSLLERVLRLALAVEPRPYSDVLALHAQVEAWRASIPPCLRIRPIKSSAFTDPNYTIFHRIMLEVMYLKTLCILHRQYLSSDARRDPQYETSRVACKDAAERLLEIHIEMWPEIQAGGRLYEDRYMVNSLTLHDFLVAAMVLCVELSEWHPARYVSSAPDCAVSTLTTLHSSCATRDKHISILRAAANIWEACPHSNDARHACRILKAILRKVDSPFSNSTSQHETPNTSSTLNSSSSMEPDVMHSAHEWHTNLANDAPFDPFLGGNSTLDWVSRAPKPLAISPSS